MKSPDELKKSITKRWIVVFFLLWIAGAISGCISRFAATRISVVDEETGKPVNGASVNCSYACVNFDIMSGPKSNTYWYKKTGDDNVLWIFGHGNAPSVNAWIDTPPANYYRGHGDHKSFWAISLLCPIPIWFPPMRNLRVGVLKKQNPIAMYSGHINDPQALRWQNRKWSAKDMVDTFAYDCVIGDWCSPHGRGLTNDLVLTYTYESFGSGTNRWNQQVTYYRKERILSFSNPDDGYLPNESKGNFGGRPQDLIAPTEGYMPKHTSYCGETRDCGWRVSQDTDAHFYFRVRTTRNADGQISGGYYGKISGRYSVYLGLYVDYILNPTPLDTNLEYNGVPLNNRR